MNEREGYGKANSRTGKRCVGGGRGKCGEKTLLTKTLLPLPESHKEPSLRLEDAIKCG